MAVMEFNLGTKRARRFPTGVVQFNISERDRQWLSEQNFDMWYDYPILLGADGTQTSAVRSIMEHHGFAIPDGHCVWRVDPTDPCNLSHDNLFIPDVLVPELPLHSVHGLTLGGYLDGIEEAARRECDEFVFVTCFQESTRTKIRFICDPEDQYYLEGTKVRVTDRGQMLIFCEDLKYRSPTQEYIRRGLLENMVGSTEAIFRRLGSDPYDLRKSQVATFRTTRKGTAARKQEGSIHSLCV